MPDTVHPPAHADLLAQLAAAKDAPAQVSVAELLALGDNLEVALAASRDQLALAIAAALDPAISFEEAETKRLAAERVEHESLRLGHALDQLSKILPDRASLADEAERLARYEAAVDARDKAAAAIRFTYPKLAADLIALVQTVVDVSDQVDAVNGDLPRRHAPLQRPDGLARGFPDTAPPGAPIDDLIVRLSQMILPDPTSPDAMAWPPGYVHHRDGRTLWPHAKIIAGLRSAKKI